MRWSDRTRSGLGFAAAILGPGFLTLILLPLKTAQQRDYVFLYLGIVAVLGVANGLYPSLLAAAASFLLVDFVFVPPYHTLNIGDEQDLVNLVVFFSVAGLVGSVGSRRRQAQLQAEALTVALRRANSELERLNREQAEAAAVAVRLAQTQQQVRVLEETDRMRREFLATVSHELRTPLATLLTGTTALALRPDVAPDVRGELSAMAGEARRLNRLVGDMLDVVRIEGHALDLQLDAVDVGAAVDAAAERLEITSPDRRVTVELPDGPLEVVSDWDRLGQILDNLVQNADRLAPPGTPITVRALRGTRGMVVVQVVDQGPGVAEAMREHLFERFVRGHDQRGPAGTGLGLAIVRGLAEAQGGRAWLERPGGDAEGTVFAFSLPEASP